MTKFNEIILKIITDNQPIQQREIWAKAIDEIGFHVPLNAIRNACRELEDQEHAHYCRKNKLGINGYLPGKAPEKPTKPKDLPKYMRGEDENEPWTTSPRPGVIRARMMNVRKGEKPAKAIATGIGSSFKMYEGI